MVWLAQMVAAMPSIERDQSRIDIVIGFHIKPTVAGPRTSQVISFVNLPKAAG